MKWQRAVEQNAFVSLLPQETRYTLKRNVMKQENRNDGHSNSRVTGGRLSFPERMTMFITCFLPCFRVTHVSFLSWVHLMSVCTSLADCLPFSLPLILCPSSPLFLSVDQSNEINGKLIGMLHSLVSLQLKPDYSCLISRILTEANTSNIFTNLRSWYPANTTCSYRFSVPETGDRISLHFLWFRVDKITFCAESLRIYDSAEPDRDKLMNKVCDTNKPMVSTPFFCQIETVYLIWLTFCVSLLFLEKPSHLIWTGSGLEKQVNYNPDCPSKTLPLPVWLMMNNRSLWKLTVNLSTLSMYHWYP